MCAAVPSGESITRRALLERATVLGAGLSVSTLLTACGGSSSPEPARRTPPPLIGFDLGFDVDQSPGLYRELEARARAVGMRARVFSEPKGPTPKPDALEEATGSRGGPRVVVFRTDAEYRGPTLREAVGAAQESGTAVVSFVAQAPGADAGIVVDPVAAAGTLVADLATWATGRGQDDGELALILPQPEFRTPDLVLAAAVERGLRTNVARRLPRWRIVEVLRLPAAVPPEGDVPTILGRHPKVRAFLGWNGQTTLGAADDLRSALPRAAEDGDDYYVGGLALTTGFVARALERRPDPSWSLRRIVVPRLDDLVDAMIDLPRALVRDERAGDVRVPAVSLVPGSASAERYRRRLTG